MKKDKLKKMLVIVPPFLPVPAVRGGAVEVLTTHLLEGNEKKKFFDIDIYTKADELLENISYMHTNIKQVKINKMHKIFTKVFNKIVHITKKGRYISEYEVYILFKLIFGRKKYDIILFENDMLISDLILKFCKHKDTKYIYHMHNDYDGSSKTPMLVKRIVKNLDAYIVISNYLRKQVTNVVKTDKVKVLYNSINIEKFKHVDEDRNSIRKKLRIDENELVYMYSGRITAEKGVLELIKAFNKLQEMNVKTPTKLLIIGESWFNSNIETEYTKNLKNISRSNKNIIFTGFLNSKEIPKYLSASDIAVIPSLWEEPFGLVVLEAMAADLLIIATRSGAIPELINDDMAIMLDKNENVCNELLDALLEAQNFDIRESKINRMKSEFNKHIEFDAENYFDEFCKIVQEIYENE